MQHHASRINPVSITNVPPDKRSVRVTFAEFERITQSGVSRRSYQAMLNRTWIAVGRIPNAITRMQAPGPGVVWMRLINVDLPVGTAIECIAEIETREPNLDVTAILFGRAKGLRRTRTRTRLRVDRSGHLIASDPEQSE